MPTEATIVIIVLVVALIIVTWLGVTASRRHSRQRANDRSIFDMELSDLQKEIDGLKLTMAKLQVNEVTMGEKLSLRNNFIRSNITYQEVFVDFVKKHKDREEMDQIRAELYDLGENDENSRAAKEWDPRNH